MEFYILVFIHLSLGSLVTTRGQVLITTNSGIVEGTVEKSFNSSDYFAFRGIPYAEPPLGELRFRSPVKKEPWDGVLDGSKNREPCIQLPRTNESTTIGSEDCLVLNVYTPKLLVGDQEHLPVLVFIHGGRWLVGSASDELYSPVYLMDRQIVVVAIQYRVAALGFLSTADEIAPGNYGLHDQVEALKWIQENIVYFGGDPKKVTISGQSAGAASSHMHLFSPRSQGLFRAIISFSGTAINFWANRVADETHLRYAKDQGRSVGCPSENSKDLIECLRTKDAAEITLVQPELHDFFGGTPAKLPLTTFSPRIDKESPAPFLENSPLEMARSGQMPSWPYLMGVTSQEGAYMTASMYGQDSMKFLQEFDENSLDAMRAFTGNIFSDEESIQKIFSFYLNNRPVANQSQRIAMTEIMSDQTFTFEALMSAYFHSRVSSKPVFMFKFDFEGQWSFAHEFEETEHDYNGVSHLDDLRYLFRLNMGPELSEDEIEVMKRFTGYVANFVTHLEPALESEWKAYLPGQAQYMVIDVPSQSGMSSDLPFETLERPGRMNFWRELNGYSEDLTEDYLYPFRHT